MEKIMYLVLIVLMFCICTSCHDKNQKENKDGTNTQETISGTDTDDIPYSNPLVGNSGIYPTVMVNGKLYEWHWGIALCILPKDSVYYGEINHIDGKSPSKDCEFVSYFPVSGQIYTISENSDCVYLLLTTDWMENQAVVFDLVK
ncbi:MAG: hypothetical protein IK071_04640 [Lachnospiraceae bacterium]|nr:hypothetical protein [Lachnospiraceae bacterium]